MKSVEFEKISRGLELFYEHRRELFLEEIFAAQLGEDTGTIQTALEDFFHKPLDKILEVLEPVRMLKVMKETENKLRNPDQDPHISFLFFDKGEAKKTEISYSYRETRFGEMLLASTEKGVCYAAYTDGDRKKSLAEMTKRLKAKAFTEKEMTAQDQFTAFMSRQVLYSPPLHLQATDFQVETWKKLLQIPMGGLAAYSTLSGGRTYAHAFGNAVGSNPIAWLIPCHRTVPATGEIGNYHWGRGRKMALICSEVLREE